MTSPREGSPASQLAQDPLAVDRSVHVEEAAGAQHADPRLVGGQPVEHLQRHLELALPAQRLGQGQRKAELIGLDRQVELLDGGGHVAGGQERHAQPALSPGVVGLDLGGPLEVLDGGLASGRRAGRAAPARPGPRRACRWSAAPCRGRRGPSRGRRCGPPADPGTPSPGRCRGRSRPGAGRRCEPGRGGCGAARSPPGAAGGRASRPPSSPCARHPMPRRGGLPRPTPRPGPRSPGRTRAGRPAPRAAARRHRRRAPRRGSDGLPAGCRGEPPRCREAPGWWRGGRRGVRAAREPRGSGPAGPEPRP